MIVGQSGSGKSVTWKMLRNTLTRLNKEKKGPYQSVKVCMYKLYNVGYCRDVEHCGGYSLIVSTVYKLSNIGLPAKLHQHK